MEKLTEKWVCRKCKHEWTVKVEPDLLQICCPNCGDPFSPKRKLTGKDKEGELVKETLIVTVYSEYGVAEDLQRAIMDLVVEWEGVGTVSIETKESAHEET